METKTKSSRMHSLVILYDMHTDFFNKAIDGISEKDSDNRLNTKANHMGWLTGSMVQSRFEMAGILGKEMKQKAFDLFSNYKGIQDGVTYPPLEDFKKDWEIISPVLRNEYCEINDEKLDSIYEIPQMKMPYYEFISFMIYREANTIGQLALWRRLLGYDAMKYM